MRVRFYIARTQDEAMKQAMASDFGFDTFEEATKKMLELQLRVWPVKVEEATANLSKETKK